MPNPPRSVRVTADTRTRIALFLAVVTVVAWLAGPAPEAEASCRTAGSTEPTATAAPPSRDNDEPTMDLFARGPDNALWHRWWVAGQPWTCWESLRGELGSGAGVASHGAGILHLGALDADGQITHRSFVNNRTISGGWSNWERLGAERFDSAPAAASWDSQHFELFAKGTDNRIWHNRYQFGGAGWTGWEAFDGEVRFASAPAAASYEPQRLHVFALGTDGRIWQRQHQDDGSWSDWSAVGDETFASAPAATSWGPDHLEVFVRGEDNRIWHNRYQVDSGDWTGWEAFDGDVEFAQAPTAASHAPGNLNVFALGTDGRIWQRYLEASGQWSAWEPMGDEQFDSAPAATSWSNR